MTAVRNNPLQHVQPQHAEAPRRDWSTTIKVLAVALFVLSLGLSVALPFIAHQYIPIACLSALCAFSIAINLFTVFRSSQGPTINIDALWSSLQSRTVPSTDVLSPTQVNHRFADIPCPSATAISVDGKYLHANRVGKNLCTRPLIASQAPLEQDFETFWKAIFEIQPLILVDLTTPQDLETGGVTPYYPIETFESKTYGSITVTRIDASKTWHMYEVVDQTTGVKKTFCRDHYSRWPDHGVISLGKLKALIDGVTAGTTPPPGRETLWVHCRAGVGRTGTIITALILKEKAARGELTKENLSTVLTETILKLREERGPLFVQTKEQLALLVEYAKFLIAR